MPVASSKQIAKALSEEKPVDAKKAVSIAFYTFNEFFPQQAGANLLLEEIEEVAGGKYWQITLGYDAKRTLSPHAKMFESENYRAYKVFTIDAMTGKVSAMKVKKLG